MNIEKTLTLKRTKQCQNCPWKVGVDPHSIPGGFCEIKHAGLQKTIADHFNAFDKEVHVMACHHSEPGEEEYCVGWLVNQLGPGNNIAMRMRMRKYMNAGELQTYGPQHQRFEDTLPKKRNKKKSF